MPAFFMEQPMLIKKSFETEAVITSSGYYAIIQPGELGEGDETVLLSPDQLRALIPHMRDALKNQSDWWNTGGGVEE